MTYIWTPRYLQGSPDTSRCRAGVHEGGRGVGFYQCSRKAVVWKTVGDGKYGFCRQHDPDAQRARREAQDAKWRAAWTERDRLVELRRLREEAQKACLEALRQIAAGHNNARALATEAIRKFDAQAGEAGTAETVEQGSVHEHAVPERDAPEDSQEG